ncbi:nitroreductase family protein [Bilifractor sp. HCP3S3_D3]|uniref:nitroreductase family protein n=1 Tax=Bilifractor sp. HCP3S3_D3 TaxID=3438907 RepID=UPI003F88E533
MEKNFLSLIKTRRSVRAYKSEPVPSKALDAVLEAGTYAPTGGGHQSPTIIAITDPKYRREIALGYPAQEAGQHAARKQNYIVRI